MLVFVFVLKCIKWDILSPHANMVIKDGLNRLKWWNAGLITSYTLKVAFLPQAR